LLNTATSPIRANLKWVKHSRALVQHEMGVLCKQRGSRLVGFILIVDGLSLRVLVEDLVKFHLQQVLLDGLVVFVYDSHVLIKCAGDFIDCADLLALMPRWSCWVTVIFLNKHF